MSVSSKWQISRTSELRFCLEKYPKMWMLIYSVHRLFEILETPKVGWKFYKILTYSISKLSNGFQQRLEVDLKFKKKKIIKLMSSGKKKLTEQSVLMLVLLKVDVFQKFKESSGFIHFQICLNCFDLCCCHQELEQKYKGKNCLNAAGLL